jgi:competence protein ComEC
MTLSKILFCFSLSFILGVFAASLVTVEQWLFLELFLLGVGCLAFSGKIKTAAVWGCCLLVFGFGLWRTSLAFSQPPQQSSAIFFAGTVQWQQKLYRIIQERLSAPSDSILAGVLWGEQKSLSYEWKQKMNISGTRHITAVSGMNIVLLAGMLTWLGVALGLWRQQATLASLVFIWLYISFIGWPASGVRAGIMVSLFLSASIFGRQYWAERAIFLAAALMLLFNPLALSADLGFQLSFLASLGLVYCLPFFQKQLNRIVFLRFFNMAELLAATFSALVLTLPWLVFNFGQLSLIAPLANVLVAFLIPVLMALGFLLTITGFIWPGLADVLAFFCHLGLNYFVVIIDWCSKAPLANVQLFISWPALVVSYLGLAVWVYKLKRERVWTP